MSVHTPTLHRAITDYRTSVGAYSIQHYGFCIWPQIDEMNISCNCTVVRENRVLVTPATN